MNHYVVDILQEKPWTVPFQLMRWLLYLIVLFQCTHVYSSGSLYGRAIMLSLNTLLKNWYLWNLNWSLLRLIVFIHATYVNAQISHNHFCLDALLRHWPLSLFPAVWKAHRLSCCTNYCAGRFKSDIVLPSAFLV